MKNAFRDPITGVLMGTCVGDSIGLPTEGMSPRRVARLGWADDLKHRLFFGYGMVSDDTEHTVMLCRAIIESGGQPENFQKRFASEIRHWFLALPPGIGKATAISCLKLYLWIPASRSGVYSAGNGPAMRSGIIGALFPNDPIQREALVSAATTLTHTDERALIGARAVTELVSMAVNCDLTDANVFRCLRELSQLPEWTEIVELLEAAVENGDPVSVLVTSLCGSKGVSGYVFHSVPVAIYAVLSHHGDFAAGLREVVRAGGDTDTVGAIYGSMAGAICGEDGIPNQWITQIRDWPINPETIRQLGKVSTDWLEQGMPPLRIKSRGIWVFRLVRNLFLFVLAVAHILMRWLYLQPKSR